MLGEIGISSKNRSQSKVAPEEMSGKAAHIFAKKLYQFQSEFLTVLF